MSRWAISPRGVGQPVGFRAIVVDGELRPGEFSSTTDPAGKVLAADGASLRDPTNAELLARAKADRWEHIKVRRQQVLDGGVTWNGHRWDTEEDDINRVARTLTSWQRALALPPEAQAQLPGPVPTSISWTTSDDQEVALTVQGLALLDATINLHIGAVFEVAKQLRAAINAATTLQAVNAVDWPA